MKLLFQKYDKDGNGVMDAGELGEFIKTGEFVARHFFQRNCSSDHLMLCFFQILGTIFQMMSCRKYCLCSIPTAVAFLNSQRFANGGLTSSASRE
jgi:hypothetical protein